MEKQLTDYFDTHDLGDALEQMPDAQFDVNIQRKTYLVSVDEAVMKNWSKSPRPGKHQPTRSSTTGSGKKRRQRRKPQK